jgi:hypothetical protein
MKKKNFKQTTTNKSGLILLTLDQFYAIIRVQSKVIQGKIMRLLDINIHLQAMPEGETDQMALAIIATNKPHTTKHGFFHAGIDVDCNPKNEKLRKYLTDKGFDFTTSAEQNVILGWVNQFPEIRKGDISKSPNDCSFQIETRLNASVGMDVVRYSGLSNLGITPQEFFGIQVKSVDYNSPQPPLKMIIFLSRINPQLRSYIEAKMA